MAENTQKTTVDVAVNGQEARDELKRLQSEADMWRDKMIAASKAGDDKAFRKAESSLRKVNTQLRTMQRNQVDVNRTINNLSSASVNDINRAIREMNRQLNSGAIPRGSKEWDEYKAKIRAAREELARINAEGNASKSWIDKFNDGFSRFGNIAATFIAAATGITMTLSALRSKAQAKEESQANLAALTGLDEASIAWLTTQAEKLSTSMDETGLRIRQSSQQILEAYMLVGSNKPELLANKEDLNAVTKETMRLSAAASMELKPAVDATTTALNQFGEGADQAARYVNVLAAGSKVGAANVEQQSAVILKAGVAANMASLSIEQLTGMTETLAEKGIKAEVAGTGLKTFLLRLETGADDTKPSVVGLSTALDNLAAHSNDTAWLKNKFGDEAISIAKILIDSRKSVQQYTDAVTDTTIATEQAAINSDTASAKMAQLKNEMNEVGIQLMNELNPAINRTLSLFVNWERSFVTILAWMNRNKEILTVLSAGILYYTVVLNAATLATKAHNVWQQTVSFWNDVLVVSFKKLAVAIKSNPWGLIVTVVGAAIVMYQKFRREQDAITDLMKRQERIEKQAADRVADETSKVDLLRNAINSENVSRKKKLEAISQLQSIIPGYHAQLDEEGRLIKENTAAVDAYIESIKREAKAAAAREELEAAAREERRLQALLREQETAANEAQTKASLAGVNLTMQANQKLSTSGTRMLATSTNSAQKALQDTANKAKAAAAQTKQALEDVRSSMKALEKEVGDGIVPGTTDTGGGGGGGGGNDDGSDRLKKLMAEYERQAELEKRTALSLYTEILNANTGVSEQEVANRKAAAEAYTDAVYQAEVRLLQKKRDLYAQGTEEYAAADSKLQDKISQHQNEMAMAAVKAEADAAEKRIKANEDAAKAALALLKKYQQESKEEVYRADLAALDDALAKKLISEEQYVEAVRNLRKMMYDEEYANLIKQQQKTAASYQASKDQILSLLATQIAEISQSEANGVISHEEAERQKVAATEAANTAIQDLNNQMFESMMAGLQQFVGGFSQMLSSLSSLYSAQCDYEVSMAEKSWDKRIAAAKKAGKDTAKLEEQKQKEVAAIKNEFNERAEKIEIAQAIAQGAMAAINAYSSAAAVPYIGYILAPVAAAMALAATGLQIASIKKQHQAQAQGYYDGGYTGRADDHDVVGVVHGNEFVANHNTVKNPAIRPVLDAIDYAQRHNTESQLTLEDLPYTHAFGQFYGGGYTSPTVPSVSYSGTVGSSDGSLTDVLTRLSRQLEEGIYSYTTVDGPDGIARKTQRYNTIQNNKSR